MDADDGRSPALIPAMARLASETLLLLLAISGVRKYGMPHHFATALAMERRSCFTSRSRFELWEVIARASASTARANSSLPSSNTGLSCVSSGIPVRGGYLAKNETSPTFVCQGVDGPLL